MCGENITAGGGCQYGGLLLFNIENDPLPSVTLLTVKVALRITMLRNYDSR